MVVNELLEKLQDARFWDDVHKLTAQERFEFYMACGRFLPKNEKEADELQELRYQVEDLEAEVSELEYRLEQGSYDD